MKRAALGTLLLCAAACSPIPATEVLVHFSAVPSVRAKAKKFHVTITSQDGEMALDQTEPLSGSDSAVARVPIIPKDDDASRVVTVTGELLDDSDAVIEQKRIVTGFSKEKTTEVFVLFDESCEGVDDCGDGRTCEGGRCVGACVKAAAEGSDDVTPPICGSCEACTTGQCTPVADNTSCGCDGDVCNAGECIVRDKIRTVVTGSVHTCAFTENAAPAARRVYCWGDNGSDIYTTGSDPLTTQELGHGALGQGVDSDDLPYSATPLEVPLPSDERKTFQGNGQTNCVLNQDDTFDCWGTNQAGQFGDGDDGTYPDYVFSPEHVDTGIEWNLMALGTGHACGIATDSSMRCWGLNSSGQLGQGTNTGVVLSPEPVTGDRQYVAVGGGEGHTCAIALDGSLWCWGLNSSGQMGVGDLVDRNVPTEAACLSGETCSHDWKSVSVGYFSTCAIREGGALYCWGGNASGQVGIGTKGGEVPTAKPVAPDQKWSLVSAGWRQTCAVRADDQSAWCWGAGTEGQLGNGERKDNASPVRVAAGSATWLSVSSGGVHACGIQTDGTLWCWGSNKSGQVGSGTTSEDGVVTPHRVCFPGH